MARDESGEDTVTFDGETLSLEEVAEAARRDSRVEISDKEKIRDVMEKSIELRDDLIDRAIPIYGVTTGFGDEVDRQIAPEKAADLQYHAIQHHGVGTGPTLPREYARAVLLVRANNLVRGDSALRIDHIERIVEFLNRDITPVIPEEGSVGASGDLTPLSYMSAVLIGRREVLYDGEVQPTEDVLGEEGLSPLEFKPKEALALQNGTAFMAGIGALAAVDARRVALLSDVCTAMATEVLEATSSPFHPYLHDETKPHDGQIRSARNVRWLLKDSDLAMPYEEVVEEAGTIAEGEEDYRELSVNIQDQYSVRCAPQFTGVLWDALDWIEEWLETEINSSNDNPLFDVENGSVKSGGNFAGGHVAMAMDTLKNAVASVADLLDRQLELIVDDKFSNGLPDGLAPELPDDHPDKGLNHGFKGMQVACSSLTAEALSMTMPLTSFSRSTEAHNQDKVSMGATAARQTRDLVEIVERASCMHLIALCQAADIRGADRLGRTRRVYDAVREEVSFVEVDRPMDDDIEAVRSMLRDGRLLDDVASELEDAEEVPPGL